MRKVNFDYSTKNIPVPSANVYRKKLIEKTEQLIRRMRWRAYFFLNPEINTSSKNTYGFNSKRNPPYVPELKEFEHQLLDLIKKIEFTNNRCHFQRQLKTDIKNKIYDDPCMTVSADKTNNYYKITHAAYDKLVTENITKN